MRKESKRDIASVLTSVRPGHPSGVLDLLAYVRAFCFDYGISLRLTRKSSVDSGDGVKCNGYFDADTKVLDCATRKDVSIWFPVFLHEFGHAKQFVDDPIAFYRGGEAEARVLAWAYSTNASIRNRPPREDLRLFLGLERDCEQRTLALVDKFRVQDTVPPAEYAQRANAYLYFWRHFYDNPCWPPGAVDVYDRAHVWRAMPGQVLNDHMRMPTGVRSLYKTECST